MDQLKVGREVSPRIRIAFDVAEVDTATTRLIDAGAEPIAPPTKTPCRSLNAPVDGPETIRLTLFQELDRAQS
jgi:hypothetical protein